MPTCLYQIIVTSPAYIGDVTAALNNIPVSIKAVTPKKFQSKETPVVINTSNQIEIDVHVRGKRNAGVTIRVINTTTKKDVSTTKGTIGSTTPSSPSRFDIIDKKEPSQCI